MYCQNGEIFSSSKARVHSGREKKQHYKLLFFLFIFLIRIIESKSNTFYYYYSLQRLVSTTQQRLRHYTPVPAKPQKGYLVERELNGHQALSQLTAWIPLFENGRKYRVLDKYSFARNCLRLYQKYIYWY